MKPLFLLIVLFFTHHVFGVVVGIHGFMVKKDCMKKLERALIRAGFDFYPYTYEAREDTIQAHGFRLKERLKCLSAAQPGQPIHFVTHSIGGLVLRSAISYPDCPWEARIGRAVLLAPPTRGSLLARKVSNIFPINWAMGEKSGWQLMHYTPEQMLALGAFPSTCGVLVIAGSQGIHPAFDGLPNDGFVAVEETKLQTPHQFLVMRLTHGGLLTNPKSLSITRDFLLSGCVRN